MKSVIPIDKVFAVTGGTRGIGYAIARRMLQAGAKVAICGTKQETVDHALHELGHADRLFGMVADVSKSDGAGQFVTSTLDRFGRIDVLVNSAGVGTFLPVADLTPDDWDKMIGLNLSGAFYCCHQVLPIFKQQGGGDIINISSLAGKNPFAGGAAYNASKFGLNGFSEAMMLDHRSDGVRVCSVMPGSVATGFGGGQADTGADWKISPEDIAEVVVAVVCMPPRTTVSSVEIRPSRPPVKPAKTGPK